MRPAITKTTRQDKQTKSNNNKQLQPKLNIYFVEKTTKNKVETSNKFQTTQNIFFLTRKTWNQSLTRLSKKRTKKNTNDKFEKIRLFS